MSEVVEHELGRASASLQFEKRCQEVRRRGEPNDIQYLSLDMQYKALSATQSYHQGDGGHQSPPNSALHLSISIWCRDCQTAISITDDEPAIRLRWMVRLRQWLWRSSFARCAATADPIKIISTTAATTEMSHRSAFFRLPCATATTGSPRVGDVNVAVRVVRGTGFPFQQ